MRAMNLVSVQFPVFIFLVILIYFIVPKRWQWGVLLVTSYIYFFINSEWLVLVLFIQTLITFCTGMIMEKSAEADKEKLVSLADTITKEEKRKFEIESRKKRVRIMRMGVIPVLFALIFLKYYNFFAENISFAGRRFGIVFPPLDLLLPIGISFYTLQAIAYMKDICNGKIHADTNLLKFMLFMSYFPQIAQGPIPRYKHLAGQLYESHDFDYARLSCGVQLMVWGFMKKMIIADRIAIPVGQIFDHPADYRGLILFFGAAAYWLQLYTDFSGGIDIVRGFSQVLGIELEENFLQPYFAVSVEDFWRRWHVTLGGFMRDYVFYPLSLSLSFSGLGKQFRKFFGNSLGKKIPAFFAMFFVYFLVGIWHGPQWKYVAFGLWNGIFIAGGILLSDFFARLKSLLKIDERLFSWRLFQMLRTTAIIAMGSFFSRAIGLKTAVIMIRSFFRKWYDFAFIFDGTLNSLGIKTAEWFLLLIMVLLLFSVDYLHEKGIFIRGWIAKQGDIFAVLVFALAVAAVVIFGVYGPGYDAAKFIYQQF